MTYKFKQFKTEITDPTIEVVSVTDNIANKQCTVEILLTTDSARFGVSLDGFTYSESWEDSDIVAWVNDKLTTFSV